MTEQLKKATKSVLVVQNKPQEWGASNLIDVSCSSQSQRYVWSIYNFLNYTGSTAGDKLKPISYGKTNWGKGDIVLFKSYVSILPAIGVDQPASGDFDISTSFYYPTTQWTKGSNTEIEIEDKTRLSSAVLLDSFICKADRMFASGVPVFKVQNSFNNIEFNHYVVTAKSKGATEQEKMKIGLLQFTIEAEYLCTEKEDGSIVYLA